MNTRAADASGTYCASRLQTAILFGLALAVQFGAAALTPAGAGGSLDCVGDVFSTVILGAAMAWPAMFAVWAVFGPQRAVVRLPLTLWLVAAGDLCLTFGIQQNDGERWLFQGQLAAAAWPLAFAALLPPLWLVRAIRRWRLERSAVCAANAADFIATAGTKPNSQFSLRGLLSWISAAAIMLAAFRALTPEVGPDSALNLEFLLEGLQSAETGAIGLIVAFAGLPIIPLAWIVLADGRRLALRLVLGLMFLPVLVTGYGVFCSAMNTQFVAINGASFEEALAWEAGTLLNGLVCSSAARVCGYRFRRSPKKTAESQDTASAAPASISRLRFAFAAAPLVVALAGLASIMPDRVEEWRRADVATDWLRSGLFPSFADDGTIAEIESLQPITDEACQRIASVGNLLELDLGRSIGDFEALITDRQLALLAPLSRLQHLNLAGADVTDAGLKHLNKFPQLASLNLIGTQITDGGLKELAALRKLHTLRLDLTDVSDEGLATLEQFPALESVSAQLTAVSAAGAANFRKLRPQANIDAGACDAFFERRSFYAYADRAAVAAQFIQVKRLHARGKAVVNGGVRGVSDASLAPLFDAQRELEDLDLRESEVTDQGLKM